MEENDLFETRRKNARLLMRAYCNGKTRIFGEKIGKDSSFVSQRVGKNPFRNIARHKGSDTAGLIEKAFDKPYGWLDRTLGPNEEMELLGYDERREKCLPWSELPLLDSKALAQLRPGSGRMPDAERHIMCPVRMKEGGFAMLMPDTSMTGDGRSMGNIPPDAVVFIEPASESELFTNDIVLARIDNNHCVLRSFIRDMESVILVPFNDNYRRRALDDRGEIIGRARGVFINCC